MATRPVFMRRALALARRGFGATSPNPMVGAVLVRGSRIIGEGWHRRAGEPHAEIEALRDAERRGESVRNAVLYVTLEPCSTHGRTPPCTQAILNAGIRRVVVGATDPNPKHAGRGLEILREAGVLVQQDPMRPACTKLNAAFNQWIATGLPFVTVKAAMTLDGKIATITGQSKWITGPESRAYSMRLRLAADAIVVGVNTVAADDPALTVRSAEKVVPKVLRRIVLDSQARTPISSKVVSDEYPERTMIVVAEGAAKDRVEKLARRVAVVQAPPTRTRVGIDLPWLLARLGQENVTSILVEGGGEVNASFLMQRLAQKVAFFYAPMVLGGRDSRKGVAGRGAETLDQALALTNLEWRRLGGDLLLEACVQGRERIGD